MSEQLRVDVTCGGENLEHKSIVQRGRDGCCGGLHELTFSGFAVPFELKPVSADLLSVSAAPIAIG